jgi:predicted metal-dependent hydrolase
VKRSICLDGVNIEYTLVQAPRRDVLIQALYGGVIRVYAPKSARLKDVDRLVMENSKMILETRERLKPAPLRDGETIMIEGAPRTVRLRSGSPGGQLAPGEFIITAPDVSDGDSVRKQAVAFLSKYALMRIRERIDRYLPLTGGEVNRVAVRAQRSRWGSCSSRHNLSFNWRLIMAPPQCLDYVVIHELCHLKEFNHSPRFWSLVEAQMPDYKVWKDYLRRNGAGLIF